jgi:hypothetical protein
MWKNMFFWLWKVQKGTSSLHREMERPSKQVAWSEEKFVVTICGPKVMEGSSQNIFTKEYMRTNVEYYS